MNERGGQTLRELCAGLDMARQSVSKHLAVLEAAGLVTTVWRGREKLHYLDAAPISDIAERWISRYHRGRIEALADIKRALEDTPMDRPAFVYMTFIRSTPEKLWRALTQPAFTRRYWGVSFETGWEAGSTMTLHQAGVTITDPAQVVLESDPYRRLSYTWHTFTEEWAQANGISEEQRAVLAAEPRSKVTFDIEDLGPTVRLTVVHDPFDAGSAVLEGIQQGWPAILSSLKTLLETGEVLPTAPIPEEVSA